MWGTQDGFKTPRNNISSLDLLAGKKRYLSLSHQYIEWIQQIYETLLPGEEFTYRRIYDKFNFPPGAAAYISRVLRDRQNTVLHEKAKEGLTKKFGNEITAYERIPAEDQPRHKMRSIKLTVREFDLLQGIVDQLMGMEKVIEYPLVTSRSKEIVVVSYDVDYVRTVSPEISKL